MSPRPRPDASAWTLAATLALPLAVAGCSSRGGQAAGAVTGTGFSPGAFVWQDLVTDDVSGARRFYGDLLGWEFRDSTRRGRPYVLVLANGDPIAGVVAVDREDPEAPVAQWVSYVSVPDVDDAVSRVAKAGGRTLVGPVQVDTAGRAAVVADPQGAPLGLARLAAGDPAPSAPRLGHFFWREYLADDVGSALGFYRDLLGYEAAESGAGGRLDYHVLRRDGRHRAGLLAIPRDEEPDDDVRPNWLPYVRVADPAALAERATSLGGRLALAPSPEIRKGTLAVVVDPSGAALALQKWPIGAEAAGQ